MLKFAIQTPSLIASGIVFSAFSLGMTGIASEMPAELDEYEWRVTISGSVESGGIYKARLSADVLDGFRSFPLDVRVVDRDGVIWPSVIFARPDRGGIDPVRITPRGRTEVMDDPGYTVKEFTVETDRRSGKIPIHNRVVVHVGGTDFIRRVEAWGGADINNLVLLGSGFLIEQKSPVPVRNRAVDYPDSTVPLLVIRVFHDAKNAGTPLDWRSTDAMRVLRDDADHEYIELKKLGAPDGEPERPGVLILHLDTGAQNRPLLYLNIDIATRDFAYPVRIFGRNNTTNSWRWVADGGIHDIAGQKQNRIALTKADFRYLKVEVYHYQEKPPKIGEIVAGAIPNYLVFNAQSDKRVYMYFGSPRYQLPMSGFSRGITEDRIGEIKDVTLSRRHANPTRVASSLQAYGKTLMRLGIGIVVLLVTIVTVRVVRHRYT